MCLKTTSSRSKRKSWNGGPHLLHLCGGVPLKFANIKPCDASGFAELTDSSFLSFIEKQNESSSLDQVDTADPFGVFV